MRGAESSKWFMSYEIYFELEYYYLWSNCNGWARSAHNNNLIYKIHNIEEVEASSGKNGP